MRESTIMHVDMDMFFVAVELLENPHLVGRPVIVAPQSHRSVVLSASYEARAYGVRSGMPLARARAQCPQATVLTPHHHLYPGYSRALMGAMHEITDQVEQVSVDEAYMDVRSAVRRLGPPIEIARRLRGEIHRRTGLRASVGIGANKTIAKIASARCKPDGLLLIAAEDSQAFLASLPVRALWGVGEKTQQVLHQAGLDTVGDVAAMSREHMVRLVGAANGAHLSNLSRGIDPREVVPVREEKSLGAEGTFDQDVSDPAHLRRELLSLCHRTAIRLRAQGLRARTVGLKLRSSDFRTITRSKTLSEPFDSAHQLWRSADQLLDAQLPLDQPVRLIGVRAESLESSEAGLQLSLDGTQERWSAVEAAMDEARQRFASVELGPASMLGFRSTKDRSDRL